MNNLKVKARLAGLSYLLIIVCGIFSHMVVRTNIIVVNDPTLTARNIMENDNLFRMSILSDFVMILSYLMLSVFLYSLFKDTNKVVSRIMICLNIVGASMMGLNMLNQQAALLILDGTLDASVFGIEQLEALSYFFMRLHNYGYNFATISYGVWLLPMGYLIIKSDMIPKVIGYLLVLGSIAYTVVFVGNILGLNVLTDITLPADIGEFTLCLFLLIKGIKNKSVILSEQAAKYRF